MAQYAQDLPTDQNNNPYLSGTPAYPSNQSWSGSYTVSSTVGLSDKTTVIQIMSTGSPVNFLWGPGSVTATAFDGSVSANDARTFVVPQSVLAANSVMGANGANGLYNKISIKATGSSSVFVAEY